MSADQFARLRIPTQCRLRDVITLPALSFLYQGADAWAWHQAHYLTESVSIVSTFYCEITCMAVTRDPALPPRGAVRQYEVMTHVFC